MGEFQRSPSKVWWAGEEGVSWRTVSASPGSQDSGFSDTETSPPIPNAFVKTASTEKQNLTANIIEKSTPDKSIKLNFSSYKNVECTTPQKIYSGGRYTKNKSYTKASRNLFRNTMETHQNSNHTGNVICSEVTSSDDSSWGELPDCVKTLPLVTNINENYPPNLSAPGILSNQNDEASTCFDRSTTSSDCESELEGLFKESPKHTSTPKTNFKLGKENMKLGRIHAMNLMQKYTNERVPPTTVDTAEEGTALKKWMEEIKHLYESECTITLQCKSIANELADKVSQLANTVTNHLRNILHFNNLIEEEFDNIKNEKNNKRPIVLRLISIIRDFLSDLSIDTELETLCNELETSELNQIPHLTAKIHLEWNALYRSLLVSEIKNLISGLADPKSELDVRAKLTGLISFALRHDYLIEIFIENNSVQVITTICEKCEGSSVRGLALRALSALCISSSAIRKLESSNGIYIITETLTDVSRPEPERIEAAALLAQITAPWIEDNPNITGLSKQSRRLVRSITKILQNSKCCQNILLCTAALANLASLDQKCIKYLLSNNTAKILLDIIKLHGTRASIYLLEQVATLIANMSSNGEARAVLIRDSAPIALMCFMQSSCLDDNVVMRLQQKSIIGLSRLCIEKEAAKQVVQMGGVERLVKLCRERNERYDNDAILVAALATLRRIAEVCGAQVVSAEDCQELIQPKLLDSFLAYSTQNESLV